MDIMVELKDIADSFKAREFSESLRKVTSLWDRIPDPKTATENSYLVIEYAVAISLKMADLEEAKKWACLAFLFTEKRQDRGEVEFLVGKVAFERGEVEEATQNFKLAQKKSHGRIFYGEDPKYKELIQ